MKCCAAECTADAAHSMWVNGDPHTEWRVCSEHIEDEAETVVPYPYNHEPIVDHAAMRFSFGYLTTVKEAE